VVAGEQGPVDGAADPAREAEQTVGAALEIGEAQDGGAGLAGDGGVRDQAHEVAPAGVIEDEEHQGEAFVAVGEGLLDAYDWLDALGGQFCADVDGAAQGVGVGDSAGGDPAVGEMLGEIGDPDCPLGEGVGRMDAQGNVGWGHGSSGSGGVAGPALPRSASFARLAIPCGGRV